MGFKEFVLIGCNILMWLLGAVLLGLGIWIVLDQKQLETNNDIPISHLTKAASIIITVAVFLLFISILGCVGSSGKTWALKIFCVAMVILLVLELTVAGLVWKFGTGQKLKDIFTQALEEEIPRRIVSESATRTIDLIQIKLECCGATSSQDYAGKLSNYIELPNSCLNETTLLPHKEGCGEKLSKYLSQKAAILGGFAVFIVIVQILALVLSILLIQEHREEVPPVRDYSQNKSSDNKVPTKTDY